MFQKYSIIFLFLSITMTSSFALAETVSQEEINKGQQEYKTRCTQCHGEKADGKGPLVDFLKIVPADLTTITQSSKDNCVTGKVLKAVLGRHKLVKGEAKMPLLKDDLTLEKVYLISEYIKSIQK